MATFAQNILTARDALAAKLAAAIAAVGPSYSVDGQSVDRMKYIADLEAQIEKLQGVLTWASGPTVLFTRGKA